VIDQTRLKVQKLQCLQALLDLGCRARQGEICERTGLSKGAVSGGLRGLQDTGIVCPAYSTRGFWKLTPKYQELADQGLNAEALIAEHLRRVHASCKITCVEAECESR
jgi:DNA-binding IclR family transcriptional regulator